ncbi:MAG: cyclase family protein [Anaerolineae bacterium]
MTPEIIDITRPLNPALAVWPGDTPFSARRLLSLAGGDSVNLTTLTLSSHTGTHADAHFHFAADGLTIDRMPLAAYIGPATVVTVEKEAGPLTPADFPGLNWGRVRRLLVHSAASNLPGEQFAESFVYPSPELADWLGQHGIVLFGADAPSMDHLTSGELPGHNALRRNGIAILEGLLLAHVPDGDYELIALPLKIEGGDGSPVRAVLRALPQ